MKVSTNELKEELSRRQEELADYLTLRLHEVFRRVIHEEFSEEEEISLFDLIVRIILQADKDPTENIANLMVLSTPDRCYELLDKETLSNSAAFIRDYLQKDNICYILKRKDG